MVIISISEYSNGSMSCLNEVFMDRLLVANLTSYIPLANPHPSKTLSKVS